MVADFHHHLLCQTISNSGFKEDSLLFLVMSVQDYIVVVVVIEVSLTVRPDLKGPLN